tara:strand:- start:4796 stop:5059 length:264 start_codon:yes stop_codon:yes gene_type:complete
MAHTIKITFSDDDQKILKNDIEDIKTWVELAVRGEQNRAWKKMHVEWTDKFIADETFTDDIPSNKADFVTKVLAQSTYKKAKDKFKN